VTRSRRATTRTASAARDFAVACASTRRSIRLPATLTRQLKRSGRRRRRRCRDEENVDGMVTPLGGGHVEGRCAGRGHAGPVTCDELDLARDAVSWVMKRLQRFEAGASLDRHDRHLYAAPVMVTVFSTLVPCVSTSSTSACPVQSASLSVTPRRRGLDPRRRAARRRSVAGSQGAGGTRRRSGNGSRTCPIRTASALTVAGAARRPSAHRRQMGAGRPPGDQRRLPVVHVTCICRRG